MKRLEKHMQKFLPLLLILLLTGVFSLLGQEKIPFTHHIIDKPLPGKSWGTGGFTLADLDGDGDKDITISRRSNNTVYWYEFEGANDWIQHEIGKCDGGQLGALSLDVNQDGFPDLVMGRFWYRNPGNLDEHPNREWERFRYNGGLPEENHDIGAADFDGDGKKEVVCYSQDAGNGTLRIYQTDDGSNWSFSDVSTSVNETVKDRDEKGVHGGFAPAGLGDLDADGDPDIVMPPGWYENPGESGDEWKLHRWNFTVGVYPNAYGTSMRSWVTDIDSDGDNDVVYADCDVQNSNLWLVLNQEGSFVRKKLAAPGKRTGSYHSLAVADFNQDGLKDIFTAEQEDKNHLMKPEGLEERGLLYIQQKSAGSPEFKLQVVHQDNPGWHDTCAGDVDGDGDIDLATKIWNADEGVYHADFWENKLKK